MNNIKKIYAISLFFILGIFMISSPSLRIYAEDTEQGSNDGGGSSNDSGGDSNDGGEKETKQGSSSSNEESNDSPKEDNNGEVKDEPKEEDNSNTSPPIDRESLKGTPEEQEKAAIEDYIHEEPGIVKPYPYVPVPKDKPIEKEPFCKDKHCNPVKKGEGKSNDEDNDSCNYYGKNICEGSKDGKTCNDEKFDCLSEYKDANGKYQNCPTGQCPNDDKPYHPTGKPQIKCHGDCPPKNWCEQHKDKCGSDRDDDWDHDHDHHHNDWCKHHECHHHHHHSSTHFSDDHNGDVTVKVHVTDYKSNDLEDVHLIIGDVYEKNLDLSSEPDTIKVDNLDIDGGDDFAVCLANEDSDEGSCEVVHASSDHDTVDVHLKVL